MTELAQRRPQSVAEHAHVDYSKALQYLGLTPGQPAAQALILVCKRYELDPLLGHVSLYDGKPYVHFAGYLHIANAHPEFAGVECVKEWDDDTYCYATVRVHRADRDFPSERTGKSRKQKRKKDGSTYTDDDADAKAFAQACRRALRMSFNVDHPDPAEDEGAGPTPAPPPVVEVARRIDQTSGPGATPPDVSGSDLNASVTGPGPAGDAGQEPPNAEAPTSPSPPRAADATSLGDGGGKAGRERQGGRATGKAAAELPPAEPSDEAEQAAFEQALADDTGGFAR